MCSRFHLAVPPDRLIERFGLRAPPPWPNASVVRPTDLALTIDPDRTGHLRTFGLRTDWSPRPLLNARSETVAQKATFRPLLLNRVLVPATAYVEWRTDGAGIKHLTVIQPRDGGLFAMAGLTDGDRGLCLMTCAPAPDVAAIHNRMPVILSNPDAEARWLDTSLPFAAVSGLLEPFPHGLTAIEEAPATPAQGTLF